MELIKLRDQLGVMRPFRGEVLVTHSTREPGRPRWVEMTVYRHEDGGYVLHRLGQSLVVHRVGGSCERQPGWVKMAWDDMSEDRVPCERCLPPDEMEEGTADEYEVEAARPIVNRCSEAADLITVLTELRPGSREPYLSRPATRLLELAAEKDPAIAAAWQGLEIPI